MIQRSRFRYVNEIAGAVVLMTLVAVVAAVLFAGRAQRWFEPTARFTVSLPAEGASGLREGSEVRLLGVVVGSVDIVSMRPEALTAQVRIRRDFLPYITTESKVTIRRSFAIAGDAFLEISRGHGGRAVSDTTTLDARNDEAPTEMMQLVLDQLRTELIPTIQQIRALADEYTKLAADLRADDKGVPRMVANIEQITQQIAEGKGLAGQLVNDPEMAADVKKLLGRVDVSAGEVEKLIGELRLASESLRKIAAAAEGEAPKLPEMVDTARASLAKADQLLANLVAASASLPETAAIVNREAQALPGLLIQAQQTLREAERLIEGVQRHWLVRDYIDQSPVRTRLPASAAGGAGLAEPRGGPPAPAPEGPR